MKFNLEELKRAKELVPTFYCECNSYVWRDTIEKYKSRIKTLIDGGTCVNLFTVTFFLIYDGFEVYGGGFFDTYKDSKSGQNILNIMYIFETIDNRITLDDIEKELRSRYNPDVLKYSGKINPKNKEE